MSTELSIATHLRLAAEAIDGARDMRPDNHFAAYLAQQAVEQVVLALALAEGIHIHARSTISSTGSFGNCRSTTRPGSRSPV